MACVLLKTARLNFIYYQIFNNKCNANQQTKHMLTKMLISMTVSSENRQTRNGMITQPGNKFIYFKVSIFQK